VQEGIDLTKIGVVALEEAGFLFLEKPRYPLVTLVRDDISTPMNQLLICAPHNLFNNGTSALVYKPLHLDVWPKSKSGKKIDCPDIFKLSILQKKQMGGGMNS
jgi:hypothetical protein